MRARYLLACLLLSGFAGLAYELLWTRLLALSFGSTLLSFSAVIAVFFGGLALGAYLAGRRSPKLLRPVRTYALIELGTGALGLLSYPLLTRTDRLIALLDPGPGLGGVAIRFGLSVPLLLGPTLLMGATLPVVSRAMVVRDEDVGRGTALIYGFNTLGAVLGVYLTTYHLLPALGVFRSLMIAVAANIAVGAIALLGDRRASAVAPRVPTEVESGAATASLGDVEQKTISVATFLALVGGFAAIAYQVVWVRIFSTFLEGTVYGVGAVLVCVLVGITAGSLFIARIDRSDTEAAVWFVGLQLGALLSSIILSRNLLWIGYQLRALSWVRGGGIEPLHQQLLVTTIVLFLPTFCSGASFPLLVRITERRAARAGRAMGYLYAANTVGSIIGSLVSGFFLLPGAGTEATAFVALSATALVGAVASGLLVPARLRVLGLGLAAASLASLALFDGLDSKRLSANITRVAFTEYASAAARRASDILYQSEGESATVTVRTVDGFRALALNGLGQGSRSDAPPHHALESVLVSLIPLAHVDHPENVLVVGLGAGSTVDVLRRLQVPHVHILELEPKVVDAVRTIFPKDDVPLDAPGVQVIINDARHHLLVARERPNAVRYDVITSMPAHPWVAANIFTREFFELAKDNLSERGVFATWFGLGKMDKAAVESLFRAFADVFPSYVIYWVPEASAYYLVGTPRKMEMSIERFTAMTSSPALRDYRQLADPYYLAVRIFASAEASTPKPPSGPMNTDDSAFVELHAPRSSTTAPFLSGFMPEEQLLPSLVAERERKTFVLELFEHLAGSPRGELPATLTASNLPRAKRTFASARSLFGETETEYFEGRIALAEGKMADARTHLERAAAAPEPIGARARKFRVLTFAKGSSEHAAALAELPPTTDVLLRGLELDWSSGKQKIPNQPIDAGADPLGWLLVQLAHARAGDAPAPVREGLTNVGIVLREQGSASALRACVEVAERFALETERKQCAAWLANKERSLADERVRQARRAGTDGDFKRAAELLEEANALAPGNPTTAALLLRALVEIGDDDAVARAKQELLFSGSTPGHVDYLVANAIAGKKGKAPLPAAETSTATPPSSATP